MDSDESGHCESEFYYLEEGQEETLNQMAPINLFPNFKKKESKKINMFFTRLGRSVWEKNCALGLEYASGHTQDLGHSFFPYGPPAR